MILAISSISAFSGVSNLNSFNMSVVEVGLNGAEQDKAINAGLFGSGERSFPGLPLIMNPFGYKICTQSICNSDRSN